MWVAIHKCMEATLGNSLYSYFHLNLAKTLFFLLSLMFFSSTKLENKRAEQVLPGSGEVWRGEVAQITYTHIRKWKNDKIKLKKRKNQATKVLTVYLSLYSFPWAICFFFKRKEEQKNHLRKKKNTLQFQSLFKLRQNNFHSFTQVCQKVIFYLIYFHRM
jgi:hypothetical protein